MFMQQWQISVTVSGKNVRDERLIWNMTAFLFVTLNK